MYKLAERGQLALLEGDCRLILPNLPPNSVDSVVTDPPYELSDGGKTSPNRVFFELMFPNNAKIKTEASGEDYLSLLISKVLSLSSVGSVPRPAAPMPISSMTLDNHVGGRDEDVKHTEESPVGSTDSGGLDEGNAEGSEHLGNFVLELTDPLSLLKLLNGAGAGFFSGSLGIGFGITPSSLPGFLGNSGIVNNGHTVVGLSDDALSRFIHTLGGAKDLPMTGFFQCGRSPGDCLSTSAALVFCLLLELSGAKLVRTSTTASSLPAVFESRCIRVVDELTNRAFTFNLIVHPQIIAGKGFMGKEWDGSKIAYDVGMWKSVLNVLKPGGHLLAFGGTRTHHRMMVAIEDAGFQIRDVVMWVYGSGFPKSLDIGKAVDKIKGAEREVVGRRTDGPSSWMLQQKLQHRAEGGTGIGYADGSGKEYDVTAPATDEAKQWDGWGTALKPAWEPVVLAMKPIEGTFANNVLEWGTGGINVDGCRIATSDHWEASGKVSPPSRALSGGEDGSLNVSMSTTHEGGRWPANLIHDGSEEVVGVFPETGASKASMRGIGLTGADQKVFGKGDPSFDTLRGHNDSGGTAARFFYQAKTSKSERNLGCDSIFWQRTPDGHTLITEDEYNALDSKDRAQGNIHPTVKPLSLIQYLVRLITPPNGVVLDPFSGSGTTMLAAYKEGFGCLAIEQDPTSNIIARARWEAKEGLGK